MSLVHRVSGAGARLEEPVSPERVIEGAPVSSTAVEYDMGDLCAGEWRASVGAWRVRYDEWEFCHLLEGACELVADDGQVQRFDEGDSFIIEPGFSGIWRVLAPMRKRFVIRSPQASA